MNVNQFAAFDENGNRDLGKVRYVEFGDIQVKFSSENSPFGFWKMHYSRGNVPWDLQGNYQTFQHAYKALQTYAAKHKRKLGETIRPDMHTRQEAQAQ
jgi:hypothetical protein